MAARPLAVLRDLEIAFGDAPLLDAADFTVLEGERIGLIGRNGTGKSTLLKILARLEKPDLGSCEYADGLKIAYLAQETVLEPTLSLKDAVLQKGLVTGLDDESTRFTRLARLDALFDRLGLDATQSVSGASGGQKKRAALATVLSEDADLYVLDEPTNHLDIEAIVALENLLESVLTPSKALVVVTHDRRFLNRLSTEIVELDRGQLRVFPGNFALYESRKEEMLNAEKLANRRFDKFWAEEEVWIRKGIEARRTRNEGRVRRLEALRRAREKRREVLAGLSLEIEAGMRSGKIVAELKNVSKAFGDKTVVEDFSFSLLKGDRLGIIGANGIGKTTLISLILGLMPPDAGTIKLGSRLQIAYFDQMREALDENKTVAENVSPGGDYLEINGKKRHVLSYLGDFLFSPRRAASPVKNLSGGEKNRLLLAKLFALSVNLIVLDEPTNDLDTDALGALEETLQTYDGTLIVVSHDRDFLDAVATELLVPDGKGRWEEFAGGYDDFERYQKRRADTLQKPREASVKKERPKTPPKLRLSFEETRLLETLPETIAKAEEERDALLSRMQEASFYAETPEAIRAAHETLNTLEARIASLWDKWEAVEKKRALVEASRNR
ncbi:MAG TPA: ABC transporter ATP-binding protein [Sutterella sp.]|nr:ABC transporter ATP-binding protein [Sutterella sp.]